LGLNTEEVPEDRLEDVPADEDPEVVGRDVCKSNRSSELTDETDAANHEAGQSQTFGTSGRFQRLGGDDTLEGGVGEREDNVEQVVESKGSLALVFANGISIGDFLQDTGVNR
jgi:hypothetical protein